MAPYRHTVNTPTMRIFLLLFLIKFPHSRKVILDCNFSPPLLQPHEQKVFIKYLSFSLIEFTFFAALLHIFFALFYFMLFTLSTINRCFDSIHGAQPDGSNPRGGWRDIKNFHSHGAEAVIILCYCRFYDSSVHGKFRRIFLQVNISERFIKC